MWLDAGVRSKSSQIFIITTKITQSNGHPEYVRLLEIEIKKPINFIKLIMLQKLAQKTIPSHTVAVALIKNTKKPQVLNSRQKTRSKINKNPFEGLDYISPWQSTDIRDSHQKFLNDSPIHSLTREKTDEKKLSSFLETVKNGSMKRKQNKNKIKSEGEVVSNKTEPISVEKQFQNVTLETVQLKQQKSNEQKSNKMRKNPEEEINNFGFGRIKFENKKKPEAMKRQDLSSEELDTSPPSQQKEQKDKNTHRNIKYQENRLQKFISMSLEISKQEKRKQNGESAKISCEDKQKQLFNTVFVKKKKSKNEATIVDINKYNEKWCRAEDECQSGNKKMLDFLAFRRGRKIKKVVCHINKHDRDESEMKHPSIRCRTEEVKSENMKKSFVSHRMNTEHRNIENILSPRTHKQLKGIIHTQGNIGSLRSTYRT